MFTGIVEIMAEVLQKDSQGISVSRPKKFSELAIGQSIAVNGACLSVIDFSETSMRFDVVPETFARTNLATAEIVNLERALPAAGRFEGHIVSGHVDGVITLLERKKEQSGEWLTFELPERFGQYFVEKGSVTLNGIALTIAALTEDQFSVAIIPHTLQETNLGLLQLGDLLNFEVDLLAKYLYKWNQGGRQVESHQV